MDSDNILFPSLSVLLFLAVCIASRRSVVVLSPLKSTSCSYVEFLLDNNLIVPEPSEVLDGIYEEFSPHPSRVKHNLLSRILPILPLHLRCPVPTDTSPRPERQSRTLLMRNAVPALPSKFGLTEARASANPYRAIKQARARAESGKLKF